MNIENIYYRVERPHSGIKFLLIPAIMLMIAVVYVTGGIQADKRWCLAVAIQLRHISLST
ncbi:hypothetical protein LH51_02475 [Nitrincola sp. A-D6]|nr:hypothetical protein LH51_11985 [Nitrincola sp. A-D6]KGK43003.1 hypothetical protein LH51_02475 [Nitrincola sp. A-D6]